MKERTVFAITPWAFIMLTLLGCANPQGPTSERLQPPAEDSIPSERELRMTWETNWPKLRGGMTFRQVADLLPNMSLLAPEALERMSGGSITIRGRYNTQLVFRQGRLEKWSPLSAAGQSPSQQGQQGGPKYPILLSRQNEVQSNSAGIQPTPENVARANDLLATLNGAAGNSLQTDSSPLLGTPEIRTNTRPLFLLDGVTGRLTFRLTPTETRTLMLRHVQYVRTNVNRSSLKILDNPALTSTSYEVVVVMGENEDRVIYVNSNGNNSWKNFIRVLADGEATASTIEASLRELVSIYKE